MKIKLLSFSDRPELSSLTFPRLRAYCRKHGYALRLERKRLLGSRDPAWCKIVLLIEELEKRSSDYLVWMDDDILITNPSCRFESFIHNTGFSSNDYPIMVQEDAVKWCPFNSGILVAKCVPPTIKHLQHIWLLGAVLKLEHRPNWEQDAMIAFHKNFCTKSYQILPYGTLQHFIRDYDLEKARRWKPGCFSAHVTGMPTEKKARMLVQILRQLVRPKNSTRQFRSCRANRNALQ